MKTKQIELYGVKDGRLPVDIWSRGLIGIQIIAHMTSPDSEEDRNLAFRVQLSTVANSIRARLTSALSDGAEAEASELLEHLREIEKLNPSTEDALLLDAVKETERKATSKYQTATDVARMLLAMRQRGIEPSVKKAAFFINKRIGEKLEGQPEVLAGLSAIETCNRKYFCVSHFWLASLVLKAAGHSKEEIFSDQLEVFFSVARGLSLQLSDCGDPKFLQNTYQWVVSDDLILPDSPKVEWHLEDWIIEQEHKYEANALDGPRLRK